MLPRKIRRTPTYSTPAQQNCSIIKKRKPSGPRFYRWWCSIGRGSPKAAPPSFHWTAHDQPVAFDAICALPMMPIGIGMHINSAIGPGASPRRVVNEQHVSAPVKAAHSPTPRTESRCNDGTETKTDSSAHDDSRPRRKKNHQRIVGRHTDECRIHRQNLNVWSAAYDDSIVAPQIAKIFCLLPHPLYRVHHVLMLREKSIAQIPGPFHIRSHNLQDRGERKQRLHAWVPR